MGRFTWLSSDLALGRFGSLLQRLRRSVVARSPAVRWGLAAVTIVVLVLLGYLGVGSLTTAESAYLGSGRRYGPDDLIKITRGARAPAVSLSHRRPAAGRSRLGAARAGKRRDQQAAARAASPGRDPGRPVGGVELLGITPRQGAARVPGAGEDPRVDDRRSPGNRRLFRLDQPAQAAVGPSAGGQALGVCPAGNRGRPPASLPNGAGADDHPDRLRAGSHRRCGHGCGSPGTQVSRCRQSGLERTVAQPGSRGRTEPGDPRAARLDRRGARLRAIVRDGKSRP